MYYNYINARRAQRQHSTTSAQSEEEPLLSRHSTRDTLGLPGSRRRSSVRRHSHASEVRHDSLSKLLDDDDTPTGTTWVRNVISILLVILAGTAGWVIAYKSGVWVPSLEDGSEVEPEHVALGAEILGYFSAVCYLG